MDQDIVLFVANPTQRDPTTVRVDRRPDRYIVIFEAIVPQPGVRRDPDRNAADEHSETD